MDQLPYPPGFAVDMMLTAAGLGLMTGLAVVAVLRLIARQEERRK